MGEGWWMLAVVVVGMTCYALGWWHRAPVRPAREELPEVKSTPELVSVYRDWHIYRKEHFGFLAVRGGFGDDDLAELDYRTPFNWMDLGPDRKWLIGQTTGFALGWGVGAAIGAKVAQPDRQVACLVGD